MPRAAAAKFFSVQQHAAALALCIAEQKRHQLGAPRAHQAGHAQDLAPVQPERNVAHAVAAKPLHLQNHLVARRTFVFGIIACQLPSDHQPDELGAGGIANERLAHLAAVPHNHGAVTDLENFLHAVRDINHRNALRLQIADDAKQDLRLLYRKRRGRLVQDQKPNIQQNRLGHLHYLHHRGRKRADIRGGVDVKPERIENLFAAAQHLRIIHDHAVAGVVAHKHVFHNGQLRHQIEFLIHGADAAPAGGDGINTAVGFSEQFDHALVGHIRAGEALYKRGFSRAVFSQQRKHLALVQRKADILQRLHAGKRFSDPVKR